MPQDSQLDLVDRQRQERVIVNQHKAAGGGLAAYLRTVVRIDQREESVMDLTALLELFHDDAEYRDQPLLRPLAQDDSRGEGRYRTR